MPNAAGASRHTVDLPDDGCWDLEIPGGQITPPRVARGLSFLLRRLRPVIHVSARRIKRCDICGKRLKNATRRLEAAGGVQFLDQHGKFMHSHLTKARARELLEASRKTKEGGGLEGIGKVSARADRQATARVLLLLAEMLANTKLDV